LRSIRRPDAASRSPADPFGIEPLYVAALPQALVFASEVRTVRLASGLVPDDLDPAGMAPMLAYGATQDPLTIHRADQVVSGGVMPVDRWRCSPAASAAAAPAAATGASPTRRAGSTEPEAIRKIKVQLNASVRDQCIADVPLVVFLSGESHRATLTESRLTIPSICTRIPWALSRPARPMKRPPPAETARAIGTIHGRDDPRRRLAALQFQELAQGSGSPSIDGLNTYVVSEVVKNRGATVGALGHRRDELFGGYGQFRSIPRIRPWLQAAAVMPASVRRSVASLLLRGLPPTKRQKAIDLISSSASAVDLALAARRASPDSDLVGLGLRPCDLGLSSAYVPLEAYAVLSNVRGDDFRAISQAECGFYMANTLLRDADVNSMAHSLEVRVPFLGRTISETAMRLPAAFRRLRMPLRSICCGRRCKTPCQPVCLRGRSPASRCRSANGWPGRCEMPVRRRSNRWLPVRPWIGQPSTNCGRSIMRPDRPSRVGRGLLALVVLGNYLAK